MYWNAHHQSAQSVECRWCFWHHKLTKCCCTQTDSSHLLTVQDPMHLVQVQTIHQHWILPIGSWPIMVKLKTLAVDTMKVVPLVVVATARNILFPSSETSMSRMETASAIILCWSHAMEEWHTSKHGERIPCHHEVVLWYSDINNHKTSDYV